MKNFLSDAKMTKATLGVGEQPRDIRWHSGVPLPAKGDYLAEIMVEEEDAHIVYTFYVYWDGENPYVYDNNAIDSIQTTYPLENILSWAYDGNEV